MLTFECIFLGHCEEVLNLFLFSPQKPLALFVMLVWHPFLCLVISQKPVLVSSQTFSAFLHTHCPVVNERFSPTPWCWGGRLQTLVCALFKSGPPVTYRKCAEPSSFCSASSSAALRNDYISLYPTANSFVQPMEARFPWTGWTTRPAPPTQSPLLAPRWWCSQAWRGTASSGMCATPSARRAAGATGQRCNLCSSQKTVYLCAKMSWKTGTHPVALPPVKAIVVEFLFLISNLN